MYTLYIHVHSMRCVMSVRGAPKRVPEKKGQKEEWKKGEREGGGEEKSCKCFFQPFPSYATGILFFFLPKLFYYDVSWNLTIIVKICNNNINIWNQRANLSGLKYILRGSRIFQI